MFLAALRESTNSHHRNLESSPLLSALFKPDFDRTAYTLILKKFYGFLLPLEALVYEPALWSGWGLDIERRRKASLLEKDLIYLGCGQYDLGTIPLCRDLPPTGDINMCLGILYVCEGSTLGGQVISKKLSQSLGTGPERGGSYFSGYGSQTVPLWKILCEKIESYAASNESARPMIENAASATFEKMKNWFDKEEV
ncbi:biliverdin-producing heme oxygenase [Lacisediminimonas sp.]|uniref:biliverdin-producing heme oxygenase n=1 Tax=Lacisediminimonas sp. TaxID=3060582 RepID=UPI002726CD88|nr:biliverdin-producing heme oxygenase [Lacisediminimonas sp.]MDO8298421.1 biliverdin-producing heme oxygenase [Lacisediminimonas sp.]